jgi:hypothetical protein
MSLFNCVTAREAKPNYLYPENPKGWEEESQMLKWIVLGLVWPEEASRSVLLFQADTEEECEKFILEMRECHPTMTCSMYEFSKRGESTPSPEQEIPEECPYCGALRSESFLDTNNNDGSFYVSFGCGMRTNIATNGDWEDTYRPLECWQGQVNKLEDELEREKYG